MSRLSLHPSVILAWKIANTEACLSGSTRIEPVHFWYSCLRILDDSFTNDAKQLDFQAEELKKINEIACQCRLLTGLSDDEITTTRRQLQRNLRNDGRAGEIRTLHRTEDSRALFRRAISRAELEGSDELTMSHLLEEIIDAMRRNRGDVEAFDLASKFIQ